MTIDITFIIFEITGYVNIADEITHEVASILRRNTSLTQLYLIGILSSLYYQFDVGCITITGFGFFNDKRVHELAQSLSMNTSIRDLNIGSLY